MIDDIIKNVTAVSELSRAIAAFAGDLNIARRNWAAYPPTHPVIEASLQKLDNTLQSLFKQSQTITLGITKEGLLLGEEYVDKASPLCKTLAAVLFEKGIGTLIFRTTPSPEEYRQILSLLALKREEILAKGGIESLWQEASIIAIDVIGIRYDRFSGTEESSLNLPDVDNSHEESGNLWEQFVKVMMQGESGAAGGTPGFGDSGISPELLAATLNAKFRKFKTRSAAGFTSVTTKKTVKMMRELLFERNQTEGTDDLLAINYHSGLLNFITALDPELRRQILEGFCEVDNSDNANTAEEFVTSLGSTILQETYATAREYSSAPSLLQGVLRKLLPNSSEIFETVTPFEEVKTKVKTLLGEHIQEAYMPDEYFQDLQNILIDISEQSDDRQNLQDYLSTLSHTAIENRCSEILLHLIITDPDEGQSENLIQNLMDMCDSFLKLGEYDQVLKIMHQAADPKFPQSLRIAMRDAFTKPEFLEEILSGLTIWGKSRYDQVALLIRIIGRPFLDPLLNRMAEEDNMSLRRFLMDRIVAFGSAATPALVSRLSDNRWYVLRNIIVMLRVVAPGESLDLLRPLLKHSNLKLRHEVLKSLLVAGDHIAARMFLRDLDSHDHEVLLSAMHLVDKSSTIEVRKKLLSMLSTGGYSQLEYEVKAAAVQALAEIGNPEIIPELTKILASRSLMSFKALNRLKLDIIRSLERYPQETAAPILHKIAAGSDDLAKQAMESLRTLRSRS